MKLDGCRICNNTNLKPVLDLGNMPLANAFLDKESSAQNEVSYSLRVVWCDSCGLLQIDETIPPEILFEGYVYVSGTSETLRQHFQGLAKDTIEKFSLNSESLVVDIGSNDGTLLKEFKKLGVKVTGIEPAANIAKIAQESGINTINVFFSEESAIEIEKTIGKVDAISATNVLAHNNNLNGFLRGASHLLKDNGVMVFEVPYVVDLIEKTEFDTIYHEHLSYFSVNALKNLFERNNLKIVNVEKMQIHGGTIRVFVCKNNSNHSVSDSVANFISNETDKGLNQIFIYEKFAQRVETLKNDLVKLLNKLKEENKTIIGYGAAAKGNTLLNYFGIDTKLLDYVADRNPLKQNKLTPGTRIPVVNPSQINMTRPNYMLILAWNFSDEIMKQQSEFKEAGGHFIIPVPDVKAI